MPDLELKFSQSEGFWDAYSLYFKGEYVGGLYIERGKLIAHISDSRQDLIKVASLETYQESKDGSYDDILRKYELERIVRRK